MKLSTFVLIAAGAAQSVFAGPFDAAKVSSDARWIVHFDAERLRQSQVGAAVTKGLSEGLAGRRMDALTALIGMDLRRDISDITLYGTSERKEDGVCLIAGAINEKQLVTLIRGDAAYTSTGYSGTTIHSWNDKRENHRVFAASAGGGLLAISSSEASLKRALDIAAGRSTSLARENKLGLKAPADATLFMACADLTGLKNAAAEAQTLRAAKSGSIAIGESGNDIVATASLVAESPESAKNMIDAARGIVAMILLDEKTDARTREALRSVVLDSNGSAVTVSARIPAQSITDAINKEIAKHNAEAAPASGT